MGQKQSKESEDEGDPGPQSKIRKSMTVDGGPKEERKLKRMLAALRGNRKSKKVPKALIKQKEKFIDTMRMK